MVIPLSSKVKGFYMIGLRTLGLIGGTLLFACSVNAQDGGVAKPNLLLKQTVEGMPRGDKQEISVLTATLKPGDQTVFHTHRFPVSIYILEGAVPGADVSLAVLATTSAFMALARRARFWPPSSRACRSPR
jgi:hypothetical protein